MISVKYFLFYQDFAKYFLSSRMTEFTTFSTSVLGVRCVGVGDLFVGNGSHDHNDGGRSRANQNTKWSIFWYTHFYIFFHIYYYSPYEAPADKDVHVQFVCL